MWARLTHLIKVKFVLFLIHTMPISSINRSAIRNLVLQEGSYFSEVIKLIEPPHPTGAAINLTGYTGVANVRRSYKDSRVITPFTVTFTNRTGGILTLSLPNSVWADPSNLIKPNVLRSDIPDNYATENISELPGRPYIWDLLLTDSLSRTYRILEGAVLVTEGSII